MSAAFQVPVAGLDFSDTQQTLMRIRSNFVAWAASRQMFETICIFAQVNVVVSTQIDTLAAIQKTNPIFLLLNKALVDHYDQKQELCFFILMHELRHLTQARTFRDWSHLVNFSPLVEALEMMMPKKLLNKVGGGDLANDLDLKHEIFNVAADAAIHEDLSRMFSKEIFETASDFMTQMDRVKGENDPAKKQGLITVSFLEKIAGKSLEPDQDWLYYAKHLVGELSERIKKEPGLAQLLVDRQILRRLKSRQLRLEDFNDTDLVAIDLVLSRAKGETKKMLAMQLHQSEGGPGKEGLDYEEIYQARREINQAIRLIVEQVRKAICSGRRLRRKEVKTYSMPHKFFAEAPGKRDLSLEEAHCEAVIVLDTSGSMWIPELLNQMAGLVMQLSRKDLIKKAYCCDVKLHPLQVGFNGAVKFKGSGGTVWSRDHHSEILKDLNTKKKISIYYCTDGFVELGDALKDDRVQLNIINIPQIIDEQTYKGAHLE